MHFETEGILRSTVYDIIKRRKRIFTKKSIIGKKLKNNDSKWHKQAFEAI